MNQKYFTGKVVAPSIDCNIKGSCWNLEKAEF